MLYLLDANITITANSTYYPIDQVPEFWSWLQHQGESGHIKMPLEIMEEVRQGHNDDPLVEWLNKPEIEHALLLQESVDTVLVKRVVAEGYAPDLRDDELEQIGRDPFLIAYALTAPLQRCVVTTETSRPSAQRQNRRVPDVCRSLGLLSCGPFQLNKALGFRTQWKLTHIGSKGA
ncbi:MAG TPA: DUF4411 family protein [Bryobacteraceae bacterium]|jgi:hypothetical protein